MSDINNNAEIIDIEPENIIEGRVDPKIEPRPARSRRGIIGLAVVALLLGAVGGGWAYRDLLSSYMPSDQLQAMAARMEGLEKRADDLNTRIDAIIVFNDEMKSQLAAAQAGVSEIANVQSDSKALKFAVADVQKTLAAATTSLEDLKAQLAAGGPVVVNGSASLDLVARIDALEKDVASLKNVDQSATDSTLLSQNLADLKAKIAAGTGYQNEIDKIALIVPAADGLDVLRAHAAIGIPNAAGLAAELKLAAGSLPKVKSAAPPDDSWWGYAGSLLAGIVTIKSAGTEDWEQLALQAAALSEQGDLGSAVSALKNNEGTLPVELQKWYDRALARLDVERAVEKTSAAVLRQIAAKG